MARRAVIGPQRCVFHVLVGRLGHDGKGVDGDGGGCPQRRRCPGRRWPTEPGSVPERIGGLECRTAGAFLPPGGPAGERRRPWRPGRRVQRQAPSRVDGHLDGDPEEGQNFSGKAPLRGKHLPGNVRQVARRDHSNVRSHPVNQAAARNSAPKAATASGRGMCRLMGTLLFRRRSPAGHPPSPLRACRQRPPGPG